MSAVGRTFTKLRQQVQAVEDLCAQLDRSKAPVTLVDIVSDHSVVIQDVLTAVSSIQATLDEAVTPPDVPEVACFTYRSGDQTFQHVPEFLQVQRLEPGRYRITNLSPGESYLTSPPRFVALGNECNDGALCYAVVWTPNMTPDSFEVWFMYNGSRYDGNYGGSAPYDFLTFLLYPRSAILA